MRIGIIGAGRIGGNAAQLFAKAGHDLLVSYSRDEGKLAQLATAIGGRAGTPREAVEFGEVVLFSVPWRLVDDVLSEAGPLAGTIVIDTTNQFGGNGWEDLGGTADAAPMEAPRRPGAVYGEEVHEDEARAFVAERRSATN
jgi:predicted dinucleotide-binding enzyme